MVLINIQSQQVNPSPASPSIMSGLSQFAAVSPLPPLFSSLSPSPTPDDVRAKRKQTCVCVFSVGWTGLRRPFKNRTPPPVEGPQGLRGKSPLHPSIGGGYLAAAGAGGWGGVAPLLEGGGEGGNPNSKTAQRPTYRGSRRGKRPKGKRGGYPPVAQPAQVHIWAALEGVGLVRPKGGPSE